MAGIGKVLGGGLLATAGISTMSDGKKNFNKEMKKVNNMAKPERLNGSFKNEITKLKEVVASDTRRQKKSISTYAPHAAGALLMGAIGHRLHNGDKLMGIGSELAHGVGKGVIWGKGPIDKVLKAAKRSMSKGMSDFNTEALRYKDRNGIRLGSKLNKQQTGEIRVLVDKVKDQRKNVDLFAEEASEKWMVDKGFWNPEFSKMSKKEQGAIAFERSNPLKGVDALNGAEKSKLNSDVKREFERHLDDIDDEVAEAMYGKFSRDHKFDLGYKKKDKGKSQMMKGVGMGTGFSAANLIIHATGDSYFEEKDNDEMRNIVRESYADGVDISKYDKKDYHSPKDRLANMSRDKKRNMGKFASIKDVLSNKKVREIVREDILEAGGKSLTLTVAPAAASQLLNRDLRNGFQKVRDPNRQVTSDVIIEVPMKGLPKIASQNISELGIKAKKLLSENGEKLGRNALKSVSWVAAPTAVVAATGRDIGRDFKKNTGVDLGPIEDGKARIIIQKGSPYRGSHNDAYISMGKRASDLGIGTEDDPKIKSKIDLIQKLIDGKHKKVMSDNDSSQGIKRRERLHA